MTDRLEINCLLRELYAARVRGDLDRVCQTFLPDAKFHIAGTSHERSITIAAVGLDEIRSWLALMIKTFQLTDQTVLSVIIDGTKAAVHWRATVHSRITRTAVM